MNVTQAQLNCALLQLRASAGSVRLLIAVVRQEAATLSKLDDATGAALAETLRTFAADLDRALATFESNLETHTTK